MDKIGSDPFAPPLYPHLGALEASTQESGLGHRFTWHVKQDGKLLAQGLLFAFDQEEAVETIKDAAVADNLSRPFRIEIYGGYAAYKVIDSTVTRVVREDSTVKNDV